MVCRAWHERSQPAMEASSRAASRLSLIHIYSGYDNAYGARPLKRFLQSKVETLIARKIIEEDLAPNTKLVVDYDGDKLLVNVEK